ncbi:MAG: TetR family transcriptional regulator [Bosea sp. (in: a-proteobacteria)]|uniref:TetR family transcriptional regulator n=1 Tax=unclassified Bosea (in: a-proteobacteria) TaxID=2653178 RepID=UPI00095908B8|nr:MULTISPECIES: TetR family transcriptional regulator [unclassified Bosea (in: a-proteobacteria)]MBN9442699.1 TetR family transcriptional regulator [Bosea sp. (in: a-proteobacteria)]MBN9458774.1 TetR family transcriptional regulator [Bosea sp. (in: a-proteobacteria)]OJV04355.1 MAG: TetR family transcriptional regulator [Bosea sp. 67-29]
MPQREPSETRILTVAGEHLRRFGLKRFTVVAVAEEAGMTHANVYRYFPSRVALVDAVVDVWLKATERKLADIADGPDPADDKLERLILGLAKANRDLLGEDPHLFAALSLAVAKRHAVSRRNRTRVRALFERVVDEGIATGVFEPRDRDRAIAFVIDATHRFIHPASLALEADVPQASVDTRLSTLIRVILRVLGSGIV